MSSVFPRSVGKPAQAGSFCFAKLLAALALHVRPCEVGLQRPPTGACGAPRVLRTTYGAVFDERASGFCLPPERCSVVTAESPPISLFG